MSRIDTATVTKIAKLSRIALTDAQKDEYAGEISKILDWVEMLGEVDTDGVPQMTSVSDNKLPWRKDEVTDGNIPEAVLKNAPKSEHGCFAVPKVIDQG